MCHINRTVSISELRIDVKRICAHTSCGDVSATVVFNNKMYQLMSELIEKVVKQMYIIYAR